MLPELKKLLTVFFEIMLKCFMLLDAMFFIKVYVCIESRSNSESVKPTSKNINIYIIGKIRCFL